MRDFRDAESHEEEKSLLTLDNYNDTSEESRHSQNECRDPVEEKLTIEEKLSLRSSSNTATALLRIGLRLTTRSIARLRTALTTASDAVDVSSSSDNVAWMKLRRFFNYPDPSNASTLSETAYLNGLRGLAALAVFQYHYTQGNVIGNQHEVAWGRLEDQNLPVWYYLPMVRTLWTGAHTGVSMLFGISGYVLSLRVLTLIRQQHQDEKLLKALSSAVLRRGMRLYLPLYAASFIAMTFFWLGLIPPPWSWDQKFMPAEPAFFHQDFMPTYPGEVSRWVFYQVRYLMPVKPPAKWPGGEGLGIYDGGIPWTIPLEYYASLQTLLALLALAYVRRYAFRLMVLSAWIATLMFRDDWVTAQFLAGLSLADYHLFRNTTGQKRPNSPRPLRKFLWYGLFTMGFYLAGMPVGHYENGVLRPRPLFDWIPIPASLYATHQADRIVQNLAALFIVASVAEIPRIQRLLHRRPFQYLGRISFGLYLCHGALRTLFQPSVLTVRGWLGATEETPVLCFIAFVIWIIPTGAVNFFVAGLFQRYLDEPTNRLSRAVEQWLLAEK